METKFILIKETIMKTLFTLVFFISLNSFASEACNVCFSINPDLSMFYVEIDPIDECTAIVETKMISCENLALSIGGEEDPFQNMSINGNKVSVRFKYQVAASSEGKLSEYFSELSNSKPNIIFEKDTNRLFSTFIVTVK